MAAAPMTAQSPATIYRAPRRPGRPSASLAGLRAELAPEKKTMDLLRLQIADLAAGPAA